MKIDYLKSNRLLAFLAVAFFVSACATSAPTPRSSWCQSDSVMLDSHFEGGQLGFCQANSGNRFELTLYHENPPPDNDSPWYAMRLTGQPGTPVSIRMKVVDGKARYWPKLSNDGESWQPLDENQVQFADDGQSMRVELKLGSSASWLAGQELMTSGFYEQWNRELEALPHTMSRLAGKSAQGRPIVMTETADRPEVLLMIGRQHPPELTGAIAMKPFVETVLGDSALAKQFRDRFKVVIFPIINPDGVALGHWRHNSGSTDLNRDWGAFTQPETQLVKRWLDQFDQTDMSLRLMLDFHSTQENLFYTQTADEPTDPPRFATRWLEASAGRLPDYPFKHDARPVSERLTTKNYFYTTYGIPAITHETGDETDREDIRRSAVVFAEEMMKTLLEEQPPVNR